MGILFIFTGDAYRHEGQHVHKHTQARTDRLKNPSESSIAWPLIQIRLGIWHWIGVVKICRDTIETEA